MTFLGPELSYQYFPGADYLTPLPDACKNDDDVVAVHRYPFGGGTEPGVTATSVSGALAGVECVSLPRRVAQDDGGGTYAPRHPPCHHGGKPLVDYLPSAYTPTAALAEPSTFYARLWTADILGASLETGL